MKRLVIILILLSISLCIVPISATYCQGGRESELLSPALKVIAWNTDMVKSEITGKNVVFSPEDFKTLSGKGNIDYLEIESLPETSSGRLMLGTLEVFEGQKITSSSLSSLVFVPNAEECEASFAFNIDGDEYGYSCVIYYLTDENYAPTSAGVDESFYNIKTYKNISFYGKMRCDDPENDAVKYEITQIPKNGLLTVKSRSSGEYIYTPTKNFAGKDSFSYVAVDKYGNRSAEITVDVSVSRSKSGVVFRDLIGERAQYAAITLHEKGIMTGFVDGYGDVYLPNMSVYYGDFLKIALEAAGTEGDVTASKEIEGEIGKIPSEYRDSLASAYSMGYIELEDVVSFDCTRMITRAEAWVIVNKILDISPSKNMPVFSDIDNMPDEALSAVSALINAGFMIDGGEASADEDLTRADAAILLSELLNRI